MMPARMVEPWRRFLAVGCALVVATAALPIELGSAIDQVIGAVGLVVLVRGARRHRAPHLRPFLLLATGASLFLVGNVLVSGDTLFLEGCGRTDFPGSDPAAMYDSLNRLATLPDDTVVCAGHWYSQPPLASLGEVKQFNYVLTPPRTKEQWLMMFGAQ